MFNAKNMLEQLQDELTATKRSEEELRSANDENQFTIRNLENQANDLEAQVSSYQRQLQSMQQDIDERDHALRSSSLTIQQIADEKGQLQSRVQALEKLREELQSQSDSLEAEVAARDQSMQVCVYDRWILCLTTIPTNPNTHGVLFSFERIWQGNLKSVSASRLIFLKKAWDLEMVFYNQYNGLTESPLPFPPKFLDPPTFSNFPKFVYIFKNTGPPQRDFSIKG